jgi:hypothetical protein
MLLAAVLPLSCAALQPAEVYSETYPTTAFPTFEDCLQVTTAMIY